MLLDSTRKKKRVLKKIKMDIMNQRFCQNELRSARRPGGRTAVLGDKFDLHNSFLCAGGGENSDTCTGDGGSPLVCALNEKKGDEKRYVQVSFLRLFVLWIPPYYVSSIVDLFHHNFIFLF